MGANKRLEDRRNKCYGRCRSWFINQPDLIEPCKDACYNNDSIGRDDFLCSGNYLNDLDFIIKYGYDPCPNSGYTYAQAQEIIKQRTPTPPPVLPPPAGQPSGSVGGMDDDYEDEPSGAANGSGSKDTWIWIGGGVAVLLLIYLLFIRK